MAHFAQLDENNTYVYILIFVVGCVAIIGGHYL